MSKEEYLKGLLIQDTEEQTVGIRLNKSKGRELEFRAYLDDKVKYGLDRKETILRMFEVLKENNLLNTDIFNEIDYAKESKTAIIENDTNNSHSKKIETIKLDDTNIDLGLLD